MSPLSENPTSMELERLLQDAREGSGDGLNKALTLCRDYLVTLALEELPAGPRRETLAVDLAASALQEVRQRLAAFEGHSESDLRSWLRQILIVRTQAIPKPPPVEDLANLSTPDPGLGVTAESQRVPAAGVLPTTEPLPATLSFQAKSFFDQATKPALKTALDRGYDFPAPIDLSIPAAPAKLEGFQIVGELGRGGMGIVYRAWQERLQRWVALKCLPAAFSEDPERLRRFRQEARLTAQLTEHGIIQVHDIVEAGNTPILVLPYIEGCDLAHIIKQRQTLQEGNAVDNPHPWAPLGEKDYLKVLLPFFDKVLDSLVRLHGAGVLHRDLKPSNILLDKNANGWLTDFGLARMGPLDTSTHPGHGMGTPGFMGPEQWEGDENIDARTDVFSIGVTIYQALTLKLPYGKTKIKESTPSAQLPKTTTRSWPSHLDLVLQKAIEPDRANRYQSVADLRADWVRARSGMLPKEVTIEGKHRLLHVAQQYRNPILAGLLLAFLFVGFGTAAFLYNRGPQIVEVPGEPDVVKRTVVVETEPPGASVALIPLSPVDGTPQREKALKSSERTPLALPDVPVGDYIVVVNLKDFGFHEVLRHVSLPRQSPIISGFSHQMSGEREDGSVELPTIHIPKVAEVTKGMTHFRSGNYRIGSANFYIDIPVHERFVDEFYLDATEVTVAEYRRVMKGISPNYGDTVPEGQEAVRWVTFDQAVSCAERLGKRLPDEFEFEVAATAGENRRFPWGNDATRIQKWPFGFVGNVAFDHPLENPQVDGLFSNVAEWTSSRMAPYPHPRLAESFGSLEVMETLRDVRVVRGGPTCVIEGKPDPLGKDQEAIWDVRWREGISRNVPNAGVGFRCARSVRPLLLDATDIPKK
jgi:eukaryotic-like serine/threonine-protein kinase